MFHGLSFLFYSPIEYLNTVTQSELILLNIISSNYYLMSESINNTIESTGQFIVQDVTSRRIEDAYRIKRTKKINNTEAAESFKAISYFSYHFLPNKRRVFMLRGVSVDSSAFNLSLGTQRSDFSI